MKAQFYYIKNENQYSEKNISGFAFLINDNRFTFFVGANSIVGIYNSARP